MNPIIGIVTCGFMKDRQFVTQTYIRAVEASGGIPVIIPYITGHSCYPYYIKLCDGFLYCGGDDITPWLFGEELLTDKGTTDFKTDTFHLDLMKHILAAKLPVLGICRGMQILNLALDGTIYQDISMRPGPSLNHVQLSDSRDDVSHKVTISKNSILYKICGEYIFTNTFHHQCLKAIGRNLKITGISSDGIVESVESPDSVFTVGVQWHPECMYFNSPPMQQLFGDFTEACKNAKIIHLA